MDIGGGSSSSSQGNPVEVSWAPTTPAKPGSSDPKTNCENGSENGFNKSSFRETVFSCWEGNLGAKSQLSEVNAIYNSFSVDNLEMWNSIPCKDLLALADAAITTKDSGSGGGSSGGCGGNDSGSSFYDGSSLMLNTQQYGRPNPSKYLFDLNSPPRMVTEPPLSISGSSQFTPVTPGTGENADKQQKEKINLDKQPLLILEQSEAAISTQLEANQDLEKGLTEETNLDKTPQPKQRRRKHRPKVVIEGQPKKAKKSTPPNPDGSSTGKRKYVRKNRVDKTTETPLMEETNPITIRKTRNSCRKKINFDDGAEKVMAENTQVTENYQTIPKSQATSPITHTYSQEIQDKEQRILPSPKECNPRSKRQRLQLCDSLEAYLSMFTDYNNGSIPGLPFPTIYKKKRTEKYHSKAPETSKIYNGQDDQKSYNYMVAFGRMENFRKKRTKGVTRVRDLASFAGMMEGKQWLNPNGPSGHQRYTCMEALAEDFRVSMATKKRTKRSSIVPSSLYHYHQFLTSHIGAGPNPSLRWKSVYDIDALINQFERLDINSQMVEQDKSALMPYLTRYQEKNALVLYQQDGSIVPFEDLYNPVRRRKPRPKVNLDDETNRVWRLLLENINSQGIDGTDEDKAKWWEEERNVFRGRAASFIARMHLVQGDRRFSQWKGSVVDSVIGVFLTQNVSDHLSSSAFMSLAARYPLKSKSNNEQLHEEISSISVKEPCQVDPDEMITWHEKSNHPARDHGSMVLQDADSCEEKEVVNSNEVSKITRVGFGLKNKSENEVIEVPRNDFAMSATETSFRRDQREVDNSISPQNSINTSLNFEYFELRKERTTTQKKSEEKCPSEQSGVSVESSQATIQMFTTSCHEIPKSVNVLQAEAQEIFIDETKAENPRINVQQQSHENNCEAQEVLDIANLSAEISEVTESNNVVETSRETAQKVVESNLKDDGNLQATSNGVNEGSSKAKRERNGKAKKPEAEWDSLRTDAQVKLKRERTSNSMDSLDYEAVRCADVNEIADTIKERGMNNMLAERIKDFLNRLVRDHGSIDLEWLRDVPPDKAKEYLLSFRGLGLKSVECVRLLTLHHLAFPVDTNVGRIAVRLGWVPLQPLPESLQLHLLELYPVLESIQKYLWPRLCKLDQRTLYELHYQMITFGKVFCTKSKPNCNACPMRGECRHFASAFASARLALPAPDRKSIVSALENKIPGESPTVVPNQQHLILPPAGPQLQQHLEVRNCDPVIEEPATPEPIVEVPATPEPEKIKPQEFDIEDFCGDPEEIPTIKLNIEEFTQNLQTYMEKNMELGEGDMSRALVELTSEAASIPTPKLKNVNQLRTEHHVYELPDSHPLLEGLDKREPDDPCSYLLAIWTPGETADSIKPPEGQCSSQESGTLCNEETCFLCNSIREANSQTVRGTLLIPCRTAMRGSFPLNGTYFQVNEVFADHDSSLNPIDVPRSWLWNLPRRTVYFGTSIPTIFKGLTTEGIQYCFWRGFVCVRGFDQKTRAPRPLMARLHFPASKLKRSRGKTDES